MILKLTLKRMKFTDEGICRLPRHHETFHVGKCLRTKFQHDQLIVVANVLMLFSHYYILQWPKEPDCGRYCSIFH